jgi:integrase
VGPGQAKLATEDLARYWKDEYFVFDLDDDTFAELKTYKAKRGAISLSLARADTYVFGNNAGQIRSPNEISRRWTTRVQRAQAELDELPRVTLKGLRHTHATLLLELGEHPKVVQERLGHSISPPR